MDADVAAALAAFEASVTGKTPLGIRVAAKLREYADSDNVQFTTIDNEGESYSTTAGSNVLVHVKYKGDAGMTSLVMAHEGVHRVMNTHTIDEEIACWDLQVQYYNELLMGVAFAIPGTGAAAQAKTKDSVPGVPRLSAKAAEWAAKDQLVDYLLTKPAYQTLISASWVRSNIAKWGGARNRTAATRGMFVRLLAAGGDQGNGTLILDILETVATPADWNDVLGAAGDFNKVRNVLRNARNAPVAGNRMDALAKRWNISWQ